MIVFWQVLSKKIALQGITSIMAWRAAQRKTGLKVLAITLALTFVLPFLTWAFDPANFQIGLQSVLFDNHQVWVPKKIGTVQHTYQDGDRLVIHIQDLHCNYEVQMNIARILQRLTEKHGLRLISVEGTSLPISTAQIRTFPIKKIRQEVSDYFVRQGKLSGAEYYAATGEHTVLLEGVENARLYARNKKSVEFILKDEGQGYCFDLRDLLDSLKPGIYSPVLMKYDQQCRMYREGRVGVRQHSRFLKKIAKQLKIPFSSFSNLTAYLVSPHKLFPLHVDADQLFREIDLLDHLIRERFYTQNQEQELDQHLHRLDIIEKLLNISANSEELSEFRGHREAFRIPAFVRFIREQDKSGELEVDSGIYLLDEYLNAAEDFYEVADARSRHLADNTLKRMAKHDETLAVLVTGGYHTEHILAALKTSGVSYLSIKPRLTKQDLVNPYFSLLKNRPTPLEKLLSQDQKIFTLEPYLPTIANPDRIPKVEELPEKNLRFARLVEFFLFTKDVARNFMRTKVIAEIQNQVTKTLSGRFWQSLIKAGAFRVHPNRVLSFTLTASNKKNMLVVVWPHKGRLPLNEKILLEKAEFPDENIAVVGPENIAQVQAKLDAMSSWSLADLNLRQTVALYLAWRFLPRLLAGARILTNLMAGIPERIRILGERIAAWTKEYLPQVEWVQLAGMPGSRLIVQRPWLASVMENQGSDTGKIGTDRLEDIRFRLDDQSESGLKIVITQGVNSHSDLKRLCSRINDLLERIPEIAPEEKDRLAQVLSELKIPKTAVSAMHEFIKLRHIDAENIIPVLIIVADYLRALPEAGKNTGLEHLRTVVTHRQISRDDFFAALQATTLLLAKCPEQETRDLLSMIDDTLHFTKYFKHKALDIFWFLALVGDTSCSENLLLNLHALRPILTSANKMVLQGFPLHEILPKLLAAVRPEATAAALRSLEPLFVSLATWSELSETDSEYQTWQTVLRQLPDLYGKLSENSGTALQEVIALVILRTQLDIIKSDAMKPETVLQTIAAILEIYQQNPINPHLALLESQKPFLTAFDFKDGGRAANKVGRIIRYLFESVPDLKAAVIPGFPEPAGNIRPKQLPRLTWDELIRQAGMDPAEEYKVEILGRKIVFQEKFADRLGCKLIIKILKAGETNHRLQDEAAVLAWMAENNTDYRDIAPLESSAESEQKPEYRFRFNFKQCAFKAAMQSGLIEADRQSKKMTGKSLAIDEQNYLAIAYVDRSGTRFEQNLGSPTVAKWEKLHTSLLKLMGQLGTLARKELAHTSLANIFHITHHPRRAVFYISQCLNPIFRYSLGRQTAWKPAGWALNVSPEGMLRDLKYLTPISELGRIFESYKNGDWSSIIFQHSQHPNNVRLFEILGRYPFVLMLALGAWLDDNQWQNVNWQKDETLDDLARTLEQGFQRFLINWQSEEVSPDIHEMQQLIDWKAYARQMAVWMSQAHVKLLQEPKHFGQDRRLEKFPGQALYGLGPEAITFDVYNSEGWDPEQGVIGSKSEIPFARNVPALGLVHGDFPIQEFLSVMLPIGLNIAHLALEQKYVKAVTKTDAESSTLIKTSLPVPVDAELEPQVNRCELEILAIAQEQGEVPGLHNERDYYQKFLGQYPLVVVEQALQRIRDKQPLNLSPKIQQVLSELSKTKWIDSTKVEIKIRALSRIERSESACFEIILRSIPDKYPKNKRKPKERLFANSEIGELNRKGLSAFVERLDLWAYLNELAETDYFLTSRAIMLIFINNIQQKELEDYIRIFCDNETGPHGIAVLAGRAAERVLGKHRPLDETRRLLAQLRQIPKITMSAVSNIVGSRLTEAEIEKYFIKQPQIAAGSLAQVERAIKEVMNSRREEETRSLKDRSRIFINSLHDLKILDGPTTWKKVERLLRAKQLPHKKPDQGKGFEAEVILKVMHGIQACQGERLTKKQIEFISGRTTLVRLREKQKLIRAFYTDHQYAELSGEVLVNLLLSPQPLAELEALLSQFSEDSSSNELAKMINSRHKLEMLSRFHSLMKERQLHASARAAGYSLDDEEQLKYFLDIVSTGSFSQEKVGRAFTELVRGKPRLEYILTLLKTGAVETENLTGFIQEHVSPETQILIAKDLHWLYSQGNPLLADVRGGSPSGHDVKPVIALLNQLHGSNKLFTLLTLFLESDKKAGQRNKILELQFQEATAFLVGVVRAFINKYPLGQVRRVLTRLRPEQVLVYDQLSILATLWQLGLEPDLIRKLEQAWQLAGSDHPDLVPLARTTTKAYLKCLQNLESRISIPQDIRQILHNGAVRLLEWEVGKKKAACIAIDTVAWLIKKEEKKTTRCQKPPVLTQKPDKNVIQAKKDKTDELRRAIVQLSSDKEIAIEPGNEHIFMSALRDKYSLLAIHQILSACYADLTPDIPEELQEIFTTLKKGNWLDEQEVKEAIQKLPRLERSIDQVFRILVKKIKDPNNKTEIRFLMEEDADAIIARGRQFFQESLGLWSYLNQLSARGLSLNSWTIRLVFKAGMSPEEFNYYLTQMGWGETPRNDNKRFKMHEIGRILVKNRPVKEFSALLEKLLQVPGLSTLKISYILGSHLTKQKIKLYFIKQTEKAALTVNELQAFIRASRKKKEEAQDWAWLLNALNFAKALDEEGIIRDVVGMQAEIRRLAPKDKQLSREVKISIIKYLLKMALENTQEKLEDKHYNEIAQRVTLENILRKIPLLRLIFHDPRFINLSPDVIIAGLKSSKSWETLQLLLEIYHKESTYEQSYIMRSNYTPDIIAQYYQRLKTCGLGSVIRSTGYNYQKHREVAEAIEIIEDHPDLEPSVKNRLFDELVHCQLSLEMFLLLISLGEIEKTDLEHYLCNYTTPDLRSEMILDLLWYYEQDNPLLRRGLQPTPSGKTPGPIKRLLVRLHGRSILFQFITLLLEEAASKEEDTGKFNLEATRIKNAQFKTANQLKIELTLAYLKETRPNKLRNRMSRVMPELAQFVDQIRLQATLNNAGLPTETRKASEEASGIIISPYPEFCSLVVDNSLYFIKLLVYQSAWVKALPKLQQELLFRALMARLQADKQDQKRNFPELLKNIRSQLEAAPNTKFNKQVKEMLSALSSLESYPVFDGEVGDPYYYYLLLKAGVDAAAIEAALWIFRAKRDMPLNWTVVSPKIGDIDTRQLRKYIGSLKKAWQTDGREGATRYLETKLESVDREALVLMLWYLYNLNNIKGDQFNKNVWREIIELQEDMEVLDIGLIFTLIEFLLGPRIALQDIAAMKQDVVQSVQSNLPDVIKGLSRKGWQRGTLLTPSEAAAWRRQFLQQYDTLLTDKIIHWFGWDASRDKEINKFLKRVSRHIGWEKPAVLAQLKRLMPWEQDEKGIIRKMLAMLPDDHFREFAEEDRELIASQGWQVFVTRWKIWKLAYEENPTTGEYPSKDLLVSILLSRKTVLQIKKLLNIYQMLEYLVHSESLSRDDWQNLIRKKHPDESRAAMELMLKTIGKMPRKNWSQEVIQAGLKRLDLDRIVESYTLRCAFNELEGLKKPETPAQLVINSVTQLVENKKGKTMRRRVHISGQEGFLLVRLMGYIAAFFVGALGARGWLPNGDWQTVSLLGAGNGLALIVIYAVWLKYRSRFSGRMLKKWVVRQIERIHDFGAGPQGFVLKGLSRIVRTLRVTRRQLDQNDALPDTAPGPELEQPDLLPLDSVLNRSWLDSKPVIIKLLQFLFTPQLQLKARFRGFRLLHGVVFQVFKLVALAYVGIRPTRADSKKPMSRKLSLRERQVIWTDIPTARKSNPDIFRVLPLSRRHKSFFKNLLFGKVFGDYGIPDQDGPYTIDIYLPDQLFFAAQAGPVNQLLSDLALWRQISEYQQAIGQLNNTISATITRSRLTEQLLSSQQEITKAHAAYLRFARRMNQTQAEALLGEMIAVLKQQHLDLAQIPANTDGAVLLRNKLVDSLATFNELMRIMPEFKSQPIKLTGKILANNTDTIWMPTIGRMRWLGAYLDMLEYIGIVFDRRKLKERRKRPLRLNINAA
ncbi:hypothetical protein KAR34_08225 [bacterium]|nr:hypothetical protein [bacterium]